MEPLLLRVTVPPSPPVPPVPPTPTVTPKLVAASFRGRRGVVAGAAVAAATTDALGVDAAEGILAEGRDQPLEVGEADDAAGAAAAARAAHGNEDRDRAPFEAGRQ